MTKPCTHELIPIDEDWIDEGSLQITLQCGKCQAKFMGVVIQQR